MEIWIRRILSLLVAYALQRLLFLSFNFSVLSLMPTLTLVLAILDGIRFDLCVIATVNLPLLVIHSLRFMPLKANATRWIDQFVSVLFLICNVPLIVFGIVDSRLFTFTGRRISPEIFDIGGDIKGQSLGILIQYWYITLPGLLAVALFARFTWQTNHSRGAAGQVSLRSNGALTILTLAVGFLLIRGGWQTKPLAPAHAYAWQPAALANLVLNSGMTVLRTPPAATVRRYNDFESFDVIHPILAPDRQFPQPDAPLKGKNFVIFVIESLATEYVGFLNGGKGYTPFIDDLSKRSTAFTQSYANGRRSIDAMPAIFSGIPAWRDQPFVTSPYAANRIESLPRVMSDIGYQTMFFHGASNGSMHFDVFSKIAGFQQYIGKNEHPNKADDDGQWGIFDEPFMQFAAETFSATKQPFFAGIFTLTSHNPFKIPAKYNGKFPKGTLPIHESIAYADYALAQFFETAAKTTWYQNTVFIITGDHTSLSDNPAYNTLSGRFQVPIIFFDPSGSLPKTDTSKIATHVDIKPTVMELIGLPQIHYGYFGGPLFNPAWPGRFVQQEYETWYLRDHAVQVRIDGDQKPTVFPSSDTDFRNPSADSSSENAAHGVRTLKAARQYFNNGLLDNSWYRD